MAQTISVPHQARASWRDYYELTKPKVVALLLLTALVGACLAVPGLPDMSLLVPAMLGIGMLSGAAAAINHVVDDQIDAKMARTHNRPLPKGRVKKSNAILFALMTAAVGFVILYSLVNAITAWLTLASLFGYAVVYTMFLKRATPQNIVIGGLAGAMPPLLGWTSMTGEIHGHGLLLVMIIFTWTPPHFWALAIHRRDDYAKAEVPMLPVTHGIAFTKMCVLFYSLLLVVIGFMPYLVGMTGVVYLVGATALNLGFLWYAWRLKFDDRPGLAFETFKFSILHLMLMFVVLLLDHYIG